MPTLVLTSTGDICAAIERHFTLYLFGRQATNFPSFCRFFFSSTSEVGPVFCASLPFD